MERFESALLDAPSMDVLGLLYRTRAGTVTALRALLDSAAVTRLEESLDALESAGFLVRTGDLLEVDSPYGTFVALSRRRIDALEAETRRTVAIMDALPSLIRNWDLGEADQSGEHPLAARMLHGREQRGAFWRAHLLREMPPSPSWMLPDLSLLRSIVQGAPGELSDALLNSGTTTRFLLRPEVLADDDTRAVIKAAEVWGAEIRVLDNAPSWLYVDGGALAAFPVAWGESHPSSIVVVRTPPIVEAMQTLFETLWLRAEPASPRVSGWHPVLRMLAQGLTDEAIARTLGHDVRTVRRRISEAMDEFGVSSRFALGAAWSARDESDHAQAAAGVIRPE